MSTETPNPGAPAPATPKASRLASLTPWKLAAIVLVSATVGAFASGAARHAFHQHRMHGFMSGPMDPAMVDKRVGWMTERIARATDATADQKAKLGDIAKAAAKDMLPMREKMREARQKARDLLAAESVDRAAIEQLRAEQVTNMDAISKRLSTALADAADVLTPEQRKKLAEKMPMGPGRGHGWGHGWRQGWDKGSDKS